MKENVTIEEYIDKYLDEEYPNRTIQFYVDYRDSLPEDSIRNIIEDCKSGNNVDDIYFSLNDMVNYDLDNDFNDYFYEEITSIRDDIFAKLSDDYTEDKIKITDEVIDFNDPFDITNTIEDILVEKVSFDRNIGELVKNTRVEEFRITMSDDYKKYYGNFESYNYLGNEYKLNPEMIDIKGASLDDIKECIPNNHELNFLVQSQGYEMKDLYSDEKVKNSIFLTTLKEELCNYSTVLDGMQLNFVYTNANLSDILEGLGKDSIEILPSQNLELGLFDSNQGSGSGFSIKLEKPIVLSSQMVRDNFFLKEDSYNIKDVYGGFYNNDVNIKSFNATEEKPFKEHDIDYHELIEALNDRQTELDKENKNIEKEL